MRKDKNNALKLRLLGSSYNEISKVLGIPKGTLSSWFSGIKLPTRAQERIDLRVRELSRKKLIEKNGLRAIQAAQNANKARTDSKKDIGKITDRELLLIGATIYWAEGHKKPTVINGKTKTYHPVSLTCSDPYLVKMFQKFLRRSCKVPEERFSADIRLFDYHDESFVLDYWSKLTDIPYNKISVFKSKDNANKNKLPYGTIQIRVNDTKLYHKIMGLIEGLKI